MSLSQQLMELAEEIEEGAVAHAAASYAGIPVSRGGPKAASGEAIVADHFRRGNDAKYGWPKLSPEYARRKAKQFPGKPMLVRTGRLKESVIGHGDIARVSPGVFRLRWYNIPAYHRFLAKQGRNPTRPQGLDKTEIRKAAQRYINSRIRAFKRTKRRRTRPQVI